MAEILTADHYLTRDEVLEIVKCSRSQLYNLMANDDFPRPIKMRSSNRWLRAEVDAWFNAKVDARTPRATARI